MYYLYNISETIRVPPSELGNNMKKKIVKISREEYEGMLDEDMGLVLSVTGVDDIENGKIVPGDGAVYYPAKIKMLVYKPEVHEVIEGFVTQVAEFGIFVRMGPMDGLVHVSQIMDDYINYDPKLPGFSGKETAKKITLNDSVISRIVTVSLRGGVTNSKIGMTMRQLGLGRPEWKRIDEKEKAKKGKTATGKKKGEGKPSAKGGKK
jgi:DNA-directed RNA polymerase subunit E'